MRGIGVPTFYLYGEPHRAVADGFLHVEQLDDRSRPSEWTIQPHEHADLMQIFVIDTGGGVMQADDRALSFDAPVTLIVPAGVVHGFAWTSDSSGAVVTLAQSYFAAMVDRHRDLSALADRVRALPTDGGTIAAMLGDTAALQQELGWSAIGHGAAVEAGLVALLVRVLRQIGGDTDDVPTQPGQQARLVARYRERIGDRFRLREPVSDHAMALGTSETSLRAACARIAGRSPAAMLDERAMLEARRALRYTNLSVAEVGFSIGFPDPAYFSRFFKRHAGMAPGAYRRTREVQGAAS